MVHFTLETASDKDTLLVKKKAEAVKKEDEWSFSNAKKWWYKGKKQD